MNPLYLLPLGNADRAAVEALAPRLEDAFATPVVVREAVGVNLERFHDGQRLQYNSTAIINELHLQYDAIVEAAGESPRASPRLLGISGEDLFIPILTYVFGEAQLNGRVAVVSYHRLQSERYGLPRDPALLADRLCKEAIHEVGHLHGLLHCASLECAMHISTYVEDIDTKTAALCAPCRRLLRRP